MAGGGGGEETTLEYTPTWLVAVVCLVIIAISLALEKLLNHIGTFLKKKWKEPTYLFEALRKVKEELMLLRFISLLLTVFQDRIYKICIPKHLTNNWLPCKKQTTSFEAQSTAHFQTTASFFSSFIPGGRHLLADDASATSGYCEQKGKAPLLSSTALHHLHVLIFVLGVSHVAFSALTILFGTLKLHGWKHFEDSIYRVEYSLEQDREQNLIKSHYSSPSKCSLLLSWLVSFFKQFYGSVTESDYTTLRHGFVMYIVRSFEVDFRKVVGISWYHWIFVVIFLLLNVHGWNAYFRIAFVPLILLLAVGTKLEHVITQLVEEIAQRHVVVPGELIVKPSDEHLWFGRPQFVLILIHVILFQNSFAISFFIWIWAQYGFDSCIMGEVGYIIPRLVIGVFVQFLCSYSTLPMYAFATLGGGTKKYLFEESVRNSLNNWIQRARQNRAMRKAVGPRASSLTMVQLDEESNKESAMEEGKPGETEAADLSRT